MSRPWLEVRDGEEIGRDPRKLKPAQLEVWGHSKRPILNAVRERCIDCCSFQSSEVRKCVSVKCALWPYRMATNPFTGKKGNAAALTAPTFPA